jgi:hypothetical protein
VTFKEIRARVDATVNRLDPDYVQNRDELIRAGHRFLERKFTGRQALYSQWATTDRVPQGVGTVPLPACYRASAELAVYLLPERTKLDRIPPRMFRDPFVNADGLAVDLRGEALGTPQYVTVRGRTLALRPLPSTDIDVEIVGTGWAEPLVLDHDESVLTQGAPDAVIYAACREVWLFLGDDPQKTYWETQAVAAIQEWLADQTAEEVVVPYVMAVPG